MHKIGVYTYYTHSQYNSLLAFFYYYCCCWFSFILLNIPIITKNKKFTNFRSCCLGEGALCCLALFVCSQKKISFWLIKLKMKYKKWLLSWVSYEFVCIWADWFWLFALISYRILSTLKNSTEEVVVQF